MEPTVPYPKFKPFTHKGSIFVIVTDPIEIPFYDDCCASQAAFTPLEIANPEEWKRTFSGYICWDLVKQDYEIKNKHMLSDAIFFEGTIDEGHIPFDTATSQLRGVLGLLKLAYKYYGKEEEMPKINYESRLNK